jgi:hypothetical protein
MPLLRSQPLERLRDPKGKTPPHNPSSPETLTVVVVRPGAGFSASQPGSLSSWFARPTRL